MWWSLKVNKAFASMGIDPTQFSSEYRTNMQQSGKDSGLTPEETALITVSGYYGAGFPTFAETAIGIWRKDGKIDVSKPELSDALARMGFDV